MPLFLRFGYSEKVLNLVTSLWLYLCHFLNQREIVCLKIELDWHETRLWTLKVSLKSIFFLIIINQLCAYRTSHGVQLYPSKLGIRGTITQHIFTDFSWRSVAITWRNQPSTFRACYHFKDLSYTLICLPQFKFSGMKGRWIYLLFKML